MPNREDEKENTNKPRVVSHFRRRTTDLEFAFLHERKSDTSISDILTIVGNSEPPDDGKYYYS